MIQWRMRQSYVERGKYNASSHYERKEARAQQWDSATIIKYGIIRTRYYYGWKSEKNSTQAGGLFLIYLRRD